MEELPDYDLDAELRRTLVVRARASIRMFVPIKGRPVPEITWTKDDSNLKTRAHIDNTESYTLLVIPECNRYDAGKYSLCLENVAGKRTGFVNVKVLDTPGPPVNLKPREITRNSITLQWEIPIIDGGSKIHNYIVEKRDATKKAYTVISTTWQKCSFKFADLEEGAYYYFRVSAENDLGVGEAAETLDPIRASQAPSTPENLYVTDVTADTASLAWVKPVHDGGSLITGYVIEAQKKDSDQWVHVAAIKALDYTVTDLIEGAEYTFRIMAVNASGRSDPRESRPAIIKEQTCAPSFDLRGVYQKTVIAKAGDRIKLEIPVLGKPRPVVSWKKGDMSLKETQRINTESTPTSTVLNISEIKRTDQDQYSITGKNMLGTVTETITVLVHDIPGAPTGPIKLEEVSCDYIVMSWDFANVIETEFVVTALTEDQVYEFRVIAKNSAGVLSLPSESTGSITAKDEVDPPQIDLDTKYSQPVVVNAGDTFRLEASISGKPVPTVHWLKDGQEITEAARVEIKNTDFIACIVVKEAIRIDGGQYTLLVKNVGGERSVIINVKVLDRPGPPEGPISVYGVTKEKCSISWKPPLQDGGSDVSHYIVERRETSRLVWTVVEPKVQTLNLKITKLLPGNEYIFRVSPVNKYGVGEPLESEATIAKNPFVTPNPPTEVEVSTITKDSMVVTWERPEKDGGNPIQGYIVEKRDKDGVRWTRCNKRTVTELRFRVTGLQENHSYEFQVAAENAAGVGSPSAPTIYYKALDPIFKPGPPNNPKVIDTSRSTVSLTWGKPIYDGGCEIQAYIVEACNTVSDEWILCTPPTGIPDTKFTVTKLLEKHEYQFRVCAINKVGVGEHADVPGKILLEEKLEAPDFDLDADMRKMINIRAASTLRLFVPVRGRPAPELKWGKADGEINETAQIDNTSSYASLVIENIDRFDSGKYTLTGENISGVKSVFISVRVLDSPSPPTNLVVKEITKGSVSLTWEPPLLDGGAKIKHYIVEKREMCATVKGLETVVTNLLKGEEYNFRVVAVNSKGKSDPRQLAHSVIAKDLLIEPAVRPKVSTYSVQVGYDLKVEVPIAGHPKPTISWTKDGAALKETTRVNVTHSAHHTTLTIKDATKDDAGLYSINVANNLGSKDATFEVITLDKPGPPTGPVKLEDISKLLHYFRLTRGRSILLPCISCERAWSRSCCHHRSSQGF
uniref:Titin n=1 Tax=Cynoglossus semilaevis TaxID=244447 RepID=A0A3P8X459_CYNSE